jgi:hypothetical protein
MNTENKTEERVGVACNDLLGFIVLWDDQQGVNCPMGWDADCAGAICCMNDSVAIFSDRKAARKAIAISTKYALLCRAQGKPVNLDFLGECRKNLRVVPCKPNG